MTAHRYHPLVLETAADLWTDEAGNLHPLCSCCYGCSGLTDDSDMWTCHDGLGCCDRRVTEQGVCDCRCHSAYVEAVELDGGVRAGGLDVVIAAKDPHDGVLDPGCQYLSAMAMLDTARVEEGRRVTYIEWDNFRDVTTDANGKPCCRCHLGYERVDRAITNEMEKR